MTDVTVTKESVEDVPLSLNANKAAGPDGIEKRLLKGCAEEMAPILSRSKVPLLFFPPSSFLCPLFFVFSFFFQEDIYFFSRGYLLSAGPPLLFRKSMDEGEVPRQWKEAHIVPIHKGGYEQFPTGSTHFSHLSV